MTFILPNLSLLLTVLLLLISVTAIDITYHRSSSSINQRSTFAVHWASGGSIITANIQPLSHNNPNYQVLLFLVNQYHPTHTPTHTSQLQGFAQYTSPPLPIGGEWRIEIVPKTTSSQKFLFHVAIMIDGVSLGKFTDIARYQKILTFYSAKRAQKTIKMAFPSSLSGANIQLFGPFSTLTYSGSTPLDTLSGSEYSFEAAQNRYYYIQISLTDDLMEKNEYFKVVYQTDRYKCPVDSQYVDRNGGFVGCQHRLPTNELPCIQFDYERIACIRCMNRYVATDYGLCQYDTSCPQHHYSLLGSCYPVIPYCTSFEFYGGLCYGCEDSYTLEKDDNGHQICLQVIEEEIECGEREYKVGDECLKEVENCADFDRSTGICNHCKFGYTETDNACIEEENPCPKGYFWRELACRFIDENCIFQREGVCQKCAPGYIMQGEFCQQIVCAENQYSGQGYCIQASPTCKTSDPIYGHCLTCDQGENLRKGMCVRTVPTMEEVIEEEEKPCKEREYFKDDQCHPVSDRCNTFDQADGRCKSCLEPSKYYLTGYGACLLKSQACGYRHYWSSEGCKKISDLCETYDSANGRCDSCRDGSKELDGKCVFEVECGQRQYHNEEGQCEDVDQSCVDYVPESGRCKSCIDEYEWNEGGICCWQKNYRSDEKCMKFIEKGCKTLIMQGSLPYCQMCQYGSPPRQVFGRCDNMAP